jgi:hypothetical protein
MAATTGQTHDRPDRNRHHANSALTQGRRPHMTQSGCRPCGPIAMQQSHVVCAENWYSREALASIVGPTVSVIGCQRGRQSWFGARSPCWSGRRQPAALPAEADTKKPSGVDDQIYRAATLMYSRKSRAVGLRVRFRRVATATVNCCVPRATGSALSDHRLAF